MNLNKRLVLASNSPRRAEILKNCGFEFEKHIKKTDEDFSEDTPVNEVAAYLAEKKMAAFDTIFEESIILTADTVVIINNKILNKPMNTHEAHTMLKLLSGKTHEVHTACCIRIDSEKTSFTDVAKVTFGDMNDDEINYYINTHKPFDKAGSYGVQDFIGMAKIEHIEGSFYTIMGLPIHKVYQHLAPHITWQ